MPALAALLVGLLVSSASMSTLGAYDPSQPINDKTGGSGPGDFPPPSPTRKVALGMSMTDNRNMANLDGFTASNNGNQPALWSLWSHWGVPATQDFPAVAAVSLRHRGVVPFIFWEPWDPRAPTSRDYRYERIVAGDFDAYIGRYARDAKAFGGMVILRFAHEANGGVFPWVVGNTENAREDYLAAWKRIWHIFDSEGADNVKFLWSMAKQKCVGCNPYAPFYPGDRYVDYLGFSAFNWGTADGKTWTSMFDSFRLITQHMAAISNKPIIVAETGSSDVGGDKGAWIQAGYQEVYNKLPGIVAIVYLNFDLTKDGHPDWSLARFGAGKYAVISDLPQFKGKLTLKSPQRARAIARVKAQKAEARAQAMARQQAKARLQAREAAAEKRVLKGTAEPNAKAGPVGAQKAKTTKPPRRDRTPEPPQVLDTLNR